MPSPADERPSQHHVAALDGLRGIAILLVLLHQFDPLRALTAPNLLLNVGWIGVQLFFVLSGFLITGILLDTRSSPAYYRSFFARRVLRIFPLYYGVLFLAFAVVPLLLPVPDGYGRHQGWLWVYLANFAMPFGKGEAAFPNFWSLCVEEQFYLVWPFLVRWAGLRGTAILSLAVIAIAIVSRALVRHLMPGQPGLEAAYVFTPCRADALAFGALAAVAIRTNSIAARLQRLRSEWLLAAGVIVLSLGLLAGHLARLGATMQVYGYTEVALGFAIMLLASLRPRTWYARLLSFGPLRRCGTYSYGMYVFHAPLLIYVGTPLLAHLWHGDPTLPEALAYEAAGIVATFLIGFASYHLYERHFLALKRRLAPVGAA
ncbi:MAG TPA: acyltransferase [Rhodanobacteraceae bacterium]|nr:acyltransferase [Rhodanobacteraceae bacterium]